MPYPRSNLSQYGRTYIPPGLYEDKNDNPASMYKQNYRNAYMQGGDIDAQILDDYNNRQQLEQGYRDPMNEAYGSLAETPGYTTDEAGNIIRQSQYEGLPATREEYAGLDPTDAEWGGMTGDPNRQRGWYDPAYAEEINRTGGTRQRDVRGQTATGLETGINQERDAYGRAINRDRLGVSSGYGERVTGDLAGGEAGVRESIDPSRLRQSGAAANVIRMSDADLQDYQDRTARSEGIRTSAAVGDIERSAAASGATTPAALATMRARLEQEGAGRASDAVVGTRLAARSEQARREMELEENRQRAESGLAGLRSGTEMELGARRLGQTNAGEQLRLSSERDISNRDMTAAETLGGRAQANAIETGRQGLQSEQNISAQAARTQAENQAAGIEMERNIETTGAARTAGLYDIRNRNAQFGINNRFGQGMDVQNRLSANNTTVANARRAGQGEYRDWTTGQTNTQATLGQGSMRNRISQYGATTGTTGQAAQGAAQYDLGRRNAQSWYSRNISPIVSDATSAWSATRKK